MRRPREELQLSSCLPPFNDPSNRMQLRLPPQPSHFQAFVVQRSVGLPRSLCAAREGVNIVRRVGAGDLHQFDQDLMRRHHRDLVTAFDPAGEVLLMPRLFSAGHDVVSSRCPLETELPNHAREFFMDRTGSVRHPIRLPTLRRLGPRRYRRREWGRLAGSGLGTTSLLRTCLSRPNRLAFWDGLGRRQPCLSVGTAHHILRFRALAPDRRR
jgi:hypothetical protein